MLCSKCREPLGVRAGNRFVKDGVEIEITRSTRLRCLKLKCLAYTRFNVESRNRLDRKLK